MDRKTKRKRNGSPMKGSRFIKAYGGGGGEGVGVSRSNKLSRIPNDLRRRVHRDRGSRGKERLKKGGTPRTY